MSEWQRTAALLDEIDAALASLQGERDALIVGDADYCRYLLAYNERGSKGLRLGFREFHELHEQAIALTKHLNKAGLSDKERSRRKNGFGERLEAIERLLLFS